MRLIIILGLLVRLSAVVLSCDPLTQYDDNGQCCKRCGPGTRMPSEARSCLDPHCFPCEDNEYQEGHTTDTRCKTQPYCDPNKHFIYRNIGEKSKTSRSDCTCEPGHHCSSAECLSCTAHSRCGAGLRVQATGDPTHDAVCEGCPAGTFSTGEVEVTACTAWTVCGDGVVIEANGTATSDITCGEQRKVEPGRRHKGTLILLFICLLLLAAFGITFCKFRGGSGKLKSCMQSCLPKKKEAAEDVVQRADEHVMITEIGPSLEHLSSPEVHFSLPEENELGGALNEWGRPLLTSNGNLVAQEDGKRDVLSLEETQMNSL